MSLESDLLQPDRVDDDPAQAAPDAPETPAAPETEADLDAQIEAQTIALPDGDKLVPISALAGARAQLRTAKAELAAVKPNADRAQQLEQTIAQLQGQIQQMGPVVQAYQAYVAQQQQQAAQPAAPSAADQAELEEIARDFDLYRPDGTPDLDKASRHRDREQRRAEQIAQRAVAPLTEQTVRQQASYMLARAKATVAPNGLKPDPAVLDAVWQRLDPKLVATPEGAKHAWAQAYAFTHMQQQPAAAAPAAQPAAGRDASGKFVPAAPPPLHTERAGGGAGTAQSALSPEEQRFIKQSGMTEKEYLDSAATMPGGRR